MVLQVCGAPLSSSAPIVQAGLSWGAELRWGAAMWPPHSSQGVGAGSAARSSTHHSCPVVSPAALLGLIHMAVFFQEGESDAARSLDVTKYCLHPFYRSEQVTDQARFRGKEEWIPPLPGQGERVRLHKGIQMGGCQRDISGSPSPY